MKKMARREIESALELCERICSRAQDAQRQGRRFSMSAVEHSELKKICKRFRETMPPDVVAIAKRNELLD